MKKHSRPSNVIDFNKALKARRSKTKTGSKTRAKARSTKSQKNNLITNFDALRQAQLQANRRQVRRTLLDGFIGACAVVPSKGLINVSLYNISKTGVAFDMPANQGVFQVGEVVLMRIYMNHEAYFPFEVTVQNTRPLIGTHSTRFGARFNVEACNTRSLQHFVDFIESVTTCLKTDKGDTMVSLR